MRVSVVRNDIAGVWSSGPYSLTLESIKHPRGLTDTISEWKHSRVDWCRLPSRHSVGLKIALSRLGLGLVELVVMPKHRKVVSEKPRFHLRTVTPMRVPEVTC